MTDILGVWSGRRQAGVPVTGTLQRVRCRLAGPPRAGERGRGTHHGPCWLAANTGSTRPASGDWGARHGPFWIKKIFYFSERAVVPRPAKRRRSRALARAARGAGTG